MTRLQRALKRSFDVAFSLAVVVPLGWVILLAIIAASVETRQWGLFSQLRIGRHAQPFRLYKIRTMRSTAGPITTVTKGDDPRITFLGRVMRKTKVDELPQFVNVLLGQMSVVGPRPDVPGFADMLDGDDRIMTTVRPGITGPASVAFRDEERWLSAVADAESFNQMVLWPAKIRMNCEYVARYSFLEDIKLIVDTAVPWAKLSQASREYSGHALKRILPVQS